MVFSKGELSIVGKTKLNAGRRKAESVRSHVALPETDARTLPVGHNLVVVHRLMEMG